MSKSRTTPWHLVTCLLAAFALVVSACGDSDGGDDGGSNTDVPAADEGDADADGEADTGDDGGSGENGASFRGVTEDTIKLGYTAIDFDGLRKLRPELNFAHYGQFVDVFVDDLNDRGGINGRRIDMTIKDFLPVGPTTANEACLALTEDDEVFAVMNGFNGPGAESENTCITEAHGTILIGGQPTQAQLDAANATWVTPDMSLSRRATAFATLFAETDQLDPLGKMLLLSANPEFDELTDELAAALTDAGGDVSGKVTITTTGDAVATESEVNVFLETARADGVESIVRVGAAANATDTILAAGDEFKLVIFNGDQATDFAPTTLDPTDTVLSSISLPDAEEPTTKECVDLVEEALNIEVLPPTEIPQGELNYWPGVVNTCNYFKIFEAAATAAGADLTNDSFREAVGQIGELPLATYPFASFGPDKLDGRDSLSVGMWDHDLGEWVAISDPVDVTE